MMQVSNYTGKERVPSREPQIFIAMEGLLQEQIRLCLGGVRDNDFDQPHCKLKLQANQINYRSAIALALAEKHSYAPSYLAQQLSISLKQQLCPNFAEVKVTPPAWLDFTITETAIQQWLQQNLSQIPCSFLAPPSHFRQSFPDYIRGRFYSILQLGISESLISETTAHWKVPSFPNQNWLTDGDWQFLSQLMATIDYLERPSRNRKLGFSVSQAFDQFHRHCQIFDRQQPHFPEISQLRLYLIALTQAVLAFQEA